MSSMTFTIEGDVNVQITVTETGDGALEFHVLVLDDTGSIGDLNGLFFDVNDDALVDGLSVSGADITDSAFEANSVSKVDGYNNVNGEIVKEYDKFDGGVQFGTSGMAVDDIRETTFTLSHDSLDLSLDTIALQDFAARLTSVGTEDGDRDGSLKLGTTAPDAPTGPVHEANGDTMIMGENDTFDVDMFEFFDGSPEITSVLANDTTDGGVFAGAIVDEFGTPITDPIILEGDNGGQLMLYPDGTVNFSAEGADGVNDFEHLEAMQWETTIFTYTVEGGDTATITVQVQGAFDDGGGGGGGGGISF